MLSSQTKDPVTHEAVMNLRRNLPGGLSLESILNATDAEIQVKPNVTVVGWSRKKLRGYRVGLHQQSRFLAAKDRIYTQKCGVTER